MPCLKLVVSPRTVFCISPLKRDMPILTCTFSLLIDWPWPLKCILWRFTLVASCLLSRSKRKYAPLHPGDEAVMKIHKKLFSGIPFNFTLFCYISKTTKNLKLKLWICNKKKYGLSFDIKKYTTFGWALGDEIGIRPFKLLRDHGYLHCFKGSRMGRSDKVSLRCVALLINTRFRFFILE